MVKSVINLSGTIKGSLQLELPPSAGRPSCPHPSPWGCCLTNCTHVINPWPGKMLLLPLHATTDPPFSLLWVEKKVWCLPVLSTRFKATFNQWNDCRLILILLSPNYANTAFEEITVQLSVSNWSSSLWGLVSDKAFPELLQELNCSTSYKEHNCFLSKWGQTWHVLERTQISLHPFHMNSGHSRFTK